MRIISLCPSITRLVFDLGLGSDLVGITKYCIDPAQEVAPIPKVGGTKDPKLDVIKALAPDLILLNEEENRREDYDALVAMGLCCNVTFPKDVMGAIASVQEIATVLGCPAAADNIVASIEAARARAVQSHAQLANLRWAYLIWRKPWMAVAGNNYIHGLIEEAGGRNIFGNSACPYPSVEAAELTAADPHLVILSSEPFPFKEKHREELSKATGLPLERFVLASGELLSWHGPYTAQGLDLARELLTAALATSQTST